MSDVDKTKKVIAGLSTLADEHGEMLDIITAIFFDCCGNYGVESPEKCHKALEKQFERMKKIVLPDFDDSE